MQERHNILLGTIGVFPQETEALERLTLLSWLLPTVVALATLIDVLLVLLYVYILHPWKVIIQQVGMTQNKKTSQELGNCPMGQREALLKERLF